MTAFDRIVEKKKHFHCEQKEMLFQSHEKGNLIFRFCLDLMVIMQKLRTLRGLTRLSNVQNEDLLFLQILFHMQSGDICLFNMFIKFERAEILKQNSHAS